MKVIEYKTDEKAQALAQHLGVKPSDITVIDELENYEVDGSEYRVLTDSEADEANDESIQNYIDDCILPELPEAYRFYFDDEAFMRDARMDGRGHNLNYYDGTEYEAEINGTWYYIYQTN
jgi:hypothetical protein